MLAGLSSQSQYVVLNSSYSISNSLLVFFSARELDPLVHILSKVSEDPAMVALLASTVHAPTVREFSATSTISASAGELTDEEVTKVRLTQTKCDE